jgi:hypothetical protein
MARLQQLFDEQERRHQAEILTWTTQLREAEEVAAKAAAAPRRDQCVAAVEAAQQAAHTAASTLRRIGITQLLPASTTVADTQPSVQQAARMKSLLQEELGNQVQHGLF